MLLFYRLLQSPDLIYDFTCNMYIFYDDKSCVFVYDEYFFLNGKGVQQMLKAKKPEGGENMAADTWDCAGRVRQEQIIRTRCNI